MVRIIDYNASITPLKCINLYYDDCMLVIVLVITRSCIYNRGCGYEVGDSTVELKFYGVDALDEYLRDAGVDDTTRKQVVDDLNDTIKSFTVRDIFQGVTIAPAEDSVIVKALGMLLRGSKR